MRSSWVTLVFPNSNQECPFETQKGRKQTHRGEGCPQIGVMWPQARVPGAIRSWKRQGGSVFQGLQWECGPETTWNF